MVKFLKTIGEAEVRSGYLNLTDNAGRNYGHEFPAHTTRYVVLDQNGQRSSAQQHHQTQVWGTLSHWYRNSGAKVGDTLIVSFDPNERIDGLNVIHLGLFNPQGGIRSKSIITPTIETVSSMEPFLTPTAVDIGEPGLPQRHSLLTYRILRDTAIARWLKHLHEFECQVCGMTIDLPNGERYAEVHHIRPLGVPHDGPDILENMLVLCPNHHAMCDLGAIRLSLENLRTLSNHRLAEKYMDYHNYQIAWPPPNHEDTPDPKAVM